MKRSRPYLTAKKSLFPVFWSMKTLLFVVFAALAVVIALMGDSIAAIASFASTLHYVFAALTIVMFLIIIGFVTIFVAILSSEVKIDFKKMLLRKTKKEGKENE